MAKKTRRTFLWMVNAGIAALFLFLWNKLTLNHIKLSEQKELELPFNKNKEISFFENYIVINQKEKLMVLSSHCTHLGCKINKMENGKLICPCHGSEYNLEGKPTKGPAYKNLEIIPSKLSSDGSIIEINS